MAARNGQSLVPCWPVFAMREDPAKVAGTLQDQIENFEENQADISTSCSKIAASSRAHNGRWRMSTPTLDPVHAQGRRLQDASRGREMQESPPQGSQPAACLWDQTPPAGAPWVTPSLVLPDVGTQLCGTSDASLAASTLWPRSTVQGWRAWSSEPTRPCWQRATRVGPRSAAKKSFHSRAARLTINLSQMGRWRSL